MFLLCYVAGFILRGLGSLLEQHVLHSQSRMVNTLLSERDSIVHNRAKLRVYQSKAREVLRKKGISFSEQGFSSEQGEYFFAY